jgi:hypothetical protein
MDQIKRRKIDFWLWRWHDNEEGHGSSLIIASPKGEANNRIRRKKKAMSLCLSVCLYVTLHSSGVSGQVSDFLVL